MRGNLEGHENDVDLEPFDRYFLPAATRLELSYRADPEKQVKQAGPPSQLTLPDVSGVPLLENDDIYVSGPYTRIKPFTPPFGHMLKAQQKWVKSSRGLAFASGMSYFESSQHKFLSSEPHLELTDEVCIVQSGRVYFGLSHDDDDDGRFRVLLNRQYTPTFIFAGTVHANAADREVDCPVMCFKFFPYRDRPPTGFVPPVETTKRAQQIALGGAALGLDILETLQQTDRIDFFSFENGVDTISNRTAPTPGYNLYRSYISRLGNNYRKQHGTATTSFDYVALVLQGNLVVIVNKKKGDDSKEYSVPTGQYVFVPAGVSFEIAASSSSSSLGQPTDIFCMEIEATVP